MTGTDMDRPERTPDFKLKGIVTNNIYETIHATALLADAIFINDTKHTSKAMRDFLSGDRLFLSLARAGVLHVALEQPERANPDVQLYYRSRLTREEYLERIEALGGRLAHEGEVSQKDMELSRSLSIDHAKKYGQHIHAVDPGTGNDEMLTARMVIDMIAAQVPNKLADYEMFRQKTGIKVELRSLLEDPPEQEKVDEFVKGLNKDLRDMYQKETGVRIGDETPAEEVRKFYRHAQEKNYYAKLGIDWEKVLNYATSNTQAMIDKAYNDALAVRLDDTALYDNIRTMTDGKKFAALYGASHDKVVTLAQQDGHTTLVIDIYESEEELQKSLAEKRPHKTIEGQPHIVHVLGKDGAPGTTYFTEHARPEDLEFLKTAPLPEVKTVSPGAGMPKTLSAQPQF